MSLSAEEREAVRDVFKSTPLTEAHIAQLEDHFISKHECASSKTSFDNKLNVNATDLAVIKFQLKLILGILSIIGTAIVGYIIQRWG